MLCYEFFKSLEDFVQSRMADQSSRKKSAEASSVGGVKGVINFLRDRLDKFINKNKSDCFVNQIKDLSNK